MTDPLVDLAACLAAPGQPETLFAALDCKAANLVGHKLFTLLFVDGSDVARIYSNRPAEYPVSGRKTMGETPWGKHVLIGQKPYLGRDVEAIRWAFFDHELIASMGLGSVINVPVIYGGETIGTMNLLDAEHHYREEHVPLVARLAPMLVPAFLSARASV